MGSGTMQIHSFFQKKLKVPDPIVPNNPHNSTSSGCLTPLNPEGGLTPWGAVSRRKNRQMYFHIHLAAIASVVVYSILL